MRNPRKEVGRNFSQLIDYSQIINTPGGGGSGTVTSVAMTVPTGLTVTGSPITTSGTLAVSLTAGYLIPTTASKTDWDSAFNDKIVSAAVTGTTTKTLTLTQQDAGTITASWTDISSGGTVTSILTSSPLTGGTITTSGTIGITQATTTTSGYLSSTDWNTFNNKISSNIYTADGTLTGNRTISAGGFTLTIAPATTFSSTISATTGTFSTGVDYRTLLPTSTNTTSSGTFTFSLLSGDVFTISAQSVNITAINAPIGTPVNGQKIILRITSDATARTITGWNAIYRASSNLPLPTTTIASKTLYLGFIYNSLASKWDLIAYLNNF